MSKKVRAALGVGTGLICFATVLIAYLIHKKGQEEIPEDEGDANDEDL